MMLTSSSSQTFHCATIEGVAYVTADYSLVCWDAEGFNAEWVTHVVIAAVSFTIYAPGVLVYQWYMLYKHLDALNNEKHPDHQVVSEKFGFLYSNYLDHAWYWEGYPSPCKPPF